MATSLLATGMPTDQAYRIAADIAKTLHASGASEVRADRLAEIDLATPFNFVTTHDIIGGNSGSPMLNRQGQLVGLIFDGNLHSLGGAYAYDGRYNRAVAVHPAIMQQALSAVYQAQSLVDELFPAP